MKLHIVTVGAPKLPYAKAGWQEYLARLQRFHTVRDTHVADKRANDSNFLLQTMGTSYKVALVIDGQQFTSPELADFLEKRALHGEELCFIIGGPDGLPAPVINKVNLKLGLSKLTFPHDMAMIVLLEALYRASTINAGQPYHK